MLHENKQTIAAEIRDFPEWRRGRREYTLWMIELELEAVLRRVESARRHLSGFLLTPCDRQPHVTLFVCGFLADDPRHDDDYGRGSFESHCRLLNDAAIPAFSIEIGGMNSFASAPFLEVHDRENGIARVRQILYRVSKDIGSGRFVPHVTLGLYCGVFESGLVLDRLAAFREEPLSIRVDRVTFASYDARVPCGRLQYRQQVELRG